MSTRWQAGETSAAFKMKTQDHFSTESDGSLVVGNVVIVSPCKEFSREDIARLVASVKRAEDAEARLQKALETSAAIERQNVSMKEFLRELQNKIENKLLEL